MLNATHAHGTQWRITQSRYFVMCAVSNLRSGLDALVSELEGKLGLSYGNG